MTVLRTRKMKTRKATPVPDIPTAEEAVETLKKLAISV
jgi:hypothetical protein